MKTLPILALVIAVLSPVLLAVHFALGITLLTAAGFLAIAGLDYSRRTRALSVARVASLTRAEARSERFQLAA